MFTHAVRFKLEYSDGEAFLEKFKSFFIIKRNIVQVMIYPVIHFHLLNGRFQDRQGFQPKKIHLQHSSVFNHFTIKLGYIQICIFCCGNGYVVGQLVGSNNHTCSVNSGIPDRSFQRFGHLQSIGFKIITFFDLLQFPHLFKSIFKRDADRFRNQFGEAVCIGKGQIQHACHIPDRRSCRHRSKSDDMCNLRFSIFFNHIIDHALASVIIKIDIYIRHRYPLGIQESLKQQIIFQRIDVGYTGAIGYNRTCCRPTSRPNKYIHIAGGRNEILYNQKVSGKTHFFDDIQLMVYPVGHLIRKFAIPLFCPFDSKMAQVFIFGFK